MSGPKDFLIRPSFSTQLFEGKLKRVFALQSRLSELNNESDNFKISDVKLNIHFDCRSELNSLQEKTSELTKTFFLDYNSPVGENFYELLDSRIDERLSDLTNLVNKFEIVRADFLNKKSDFDEYLSYIEFIANSTEVFEQFKSNVVSSLQSRLEESARNILTNAKKEIAKVTLSFTKAQFAFGFSTYSNLERQKIIDNIASKENDINQIRSNISDNVIETFRDKDNTMKMSKKGASWLSIQGKEVMKQIEHLIEQCDEANVRKLYEDKLVALLESEALSNVYFLQELYNKTFESEKGRKSGRLLGKMLVESHTLNCHKELISDKALFESQCTAYLSRQSVSDEDVEFITEKFNELISKNKKLIIEDDIRAKEHSFLKSQIILSLEKLGYETVDDLEVIDFENENDFLLKIRDQVNYLNLKFKEDGSMRYVFQIPEESDSLSIDKQNLKLHEMKLTCDDFKNVLSELSALGLKVELRNEKAVEVESLISVTKRHRGKVKKVSVEKALSQKKQYLKQ